MPPIRILSYPIFLSFIPIPLCFPKAPGTGEAIRRFIDEDGVSLYRTASKKADDIWDSIFDLREMLSKLYHYPHPECIAFTMNVTEALNFMIKGMISEGGHVVVTSSEHNAVMRPLSEIGAHISRIPSDMAGFSLMEKARELNQKLVEAAAENDEEKQIILDRLMPKYLVGGFSTVTTFSVIIAGFFVPLL